MKKYILIEKFRSKKCVICNNILPATNDFFNKSKSNKYKVASMCKKCKSKKDKEYMETHKAQKKITDKIYRENHKEERKTYLKTNANKISIQKKIHRKLNKDKELVQARIYKKTNKKEINLHRKKRRRIDHLFNLNLNIRSAISKAISNKGYIKKSKTEQILGCTIEEFKIHIEKQFLPWMDWNNYGKYNGERNFGWDLDHIIPINAAETEEKLIKLNHYTNFQPLCSKINRNEKRDKIDFYVSIL